MKTAGAAGCGKCRPHGNPLQSQRVPTVAWKPSAPTTSHSLDGGITYKTLTRGWVLFTLSKRHVSAFSEFAEIEGCVDSFGGPYFRDGIVEKLSRFDQVGQDV